METSDWSTGHPLLPDFFLDEAPETLVKQMEEHGEYYRKYNRTHQRVLQQVLLEYYGPLQGILQSTIVSLKCVESITRIITHTLLQGVL